MIARINVLLDVIRFLLLNLYCANKINPYSIMAGNGFVVRGYKKEDMQQITKIYSALNGNAKFVWYRKWLFNLVGSRLMLVAVNAGDSDDALVGMNMYYFNPRDVRENTIHEGFIGVVPEMNGRGIATAMRLHAKQHLALAGLDGISTRISLANTSSLTSAERVGFVPVEKYIDMHNGELRYYMISKLG